MAKRVPPDEKPYRPLDDALIRSVLAPSAPAGPPPAHSEPVPVAPVLKAVAHREQGALGAPTPLGRTSGSLLGLVRA
jgi:hypothetical protein